MRDDRLARLAEPHVVGQDRAAAAQEEGDALHLVGEEALRERSARPMASARTSPEGGGSMGTMGPSGRAAMRVTLSME
jgi:hypothetical protein